MISKFSEALCLLWRHLGLFTAIILTVWLPGNILLNYFDYYSPGSVDATFQKGLRTIIWLELVFGPICGGALVYALFQIKCGRAVTYREAIAVGFKKWGSLFAARFVAGFLTGLGLLALVIPGVVLAVRYSLLDTVVVLEEPGIMKNARSRSTDLTSGKRWSIFWAAVLFHIPFAILSFVIYLPLDSVEALNSMPVAVLLDCVLDVAYAVIQIILFLFYWEATRDQRLGEATAQAIPPENPQPIDGAQLL